MFKTNQGRLVKMKVSDKRQESDRGSYLGGYRAWQVDIEYEILALK